MPSSGRVLKSAILPRGRSPDLNAAAMPTGFQLKLHIYPPRVATKIYRMPYKIEWDRR